LAHTIKEKTVSPIVPHKLTSEPETIIMMQDSYSGDVVYSELLSNHKHFLVGEIGYDNTSRVIQWIVYEHTRTDRPEHLTLYINSGGGDLYNSFALIDMMQASKIPVHTVGMGNIMSAAALIFACGAKGHRYVAKNTGIMMHQFYSDMEGKEHELESAMQELRYCKTRVNEMLIRAGVSEKVTREKLLQPSDAWLTAEEAIKIKLADKIFTTII
jgi:ATP-dependent Clp protease protease subunit